MELPTPETSTPQGYMVNRRELITPWVIGLSLVFFSVWQQQWVALVGVPLIFIGWFGCAPNMNLANGCLPVLGTGIILSIASAIGLDGLVMAGCAGGITWLVSSLESAARCRPLDSTQVQVHRMEDR